MKPETAAEPALPASSNPIIYGFYKNYFEVYTDGQKWVGKSANISFSSTGGTAYLLNFSYAYPTPPDIYGSTLTL